MIVVLDTNMILSALFFGGMMEKVIDLIIDNKLTWYISPALLEEVQRKLHEFGAHKTLITKVRIVCEKGILIDPDCVVEVCRDSEDNFILELAQAAQADYIITRDKDLLDLPRNQWKGTNIIKPEEFLPLLRSLGYI